MKNITTIMAEYSAYINPSQDTLCSASANEHLRQGVGCWLLVVGCWLLVVGCWLLVVGCWLLVVGGCELRKKDSIP